MMHCFFTCGIVLFQNTLSLQYSHALLSSRPPPSVFRDRSVVILVPPCRHTDRPGEMCDYGNWRRRGWCRLELAGAVLARTSVTLMLVHGAQTKPEFLFPADALSLSPGLGTFTCKLV